LMLAWAIRPFRWRVLHWMHRGSILLLVALAMGNGCMFYHLAWRGVVRAGVRFPFSFGVAAALGIVFVATFVRVEKLSTGARLGMSAAFGLCLFIFPLAQMYCFGKTDYRRHADAIVVPGALVYANGSMSTALYDRVKTACDLYDAGYAPVLVFSGGPGDGAIDEPHAMRAYALARGIPEGAMVLDPHGLNTEKTVGNAARILSERGVKSALVVSHYWHLPRIKLASARAGVEVYTVPAEEERPLAGRRYLMGREIAGLWVYYLRPLWE
jgi:uncharacterized SAM-binding protein YcdF (DUF218 family)